MKQGLFEGSLAPTPGRLLWTWRDLASRLGGVSENTARRIARDVGIVPVQLGPRCIRIVAAEAEAAIAKLPRRVDVQEPQQLLRGKIDRLRRGARQIAPAPVAGGEDRA